MDTPGTIFALGGVRLTGYGLFTALGLLAGYMLSRRQAERGHIRQSALEKVCLFAMLYAMILGRAVYVVSNVGFFGEYPSAILRIWEGGISTMGAFAGALLGTRQGAGRRGFRRALDTLMPGLLLTLAVSRLGELTCWQGRGMIVGGGIFPLTISNSQGARCLAVCVYEAVVALGLMAYALRRENKPAGCVGFTCIMLLGLAQVPLESMRSDDFLALGFVKVDQLIAMIMAVTMIVMFLRGCLRAYKSSVLDFIALGVAVIMVVMCVVEEFRIDGSANPALNYFMLFIYVSVMAMCGMYLRMGWRAAPEAHSQTKARSTAPTYANSRRTSTYYPDMRESAASAPARNKQAETQAPRYSNKVDAYRRANVQSGRRERG